MLTVIKINHFFLLKAQYQSLQNWQFSNISPCYKNNFDVSVCVILTLSQEMDLMANTKLIVCLLIPDPQSKSILSILGLLIVMGKPIKTYGLAQWNMIGNQLSDSEPIGNIFYQQAAIFEIPEERFIMKPPSCSGADVSIEIYQLLLLFSIILMVELSHINKCIKLRRKV